MLVPWREHREAVRPAHHHLESLDVFRGLTIAGMILVNNPGTWDAVYRQFVHADWNGWTLADLVFPFFIVILGMALPLALSRRRESGHAMARLHMRIVRRSVLLFALGFVLNLVSAHFSWTAVRIPGVLQRIALVYLAAALITLHAPPAARAAIAAALLVGHWLVLRSTPLTPAGTIAGFIDRALFGRHLLLPTVDPEGLLGTAPALASALIGTLAGHWLHVTTHHRARIAGLAGGGAVLAVIGWIWRVALPINKPLWTGSYALFTAGLALTFFAACYAVIDVAGIRGWARPFVWLGVNPLAIYFLAELFADLIEATTVKTTLYWGRLHPVVSPPLSEPGASLLFAILTVMVWTTVAGVMYRRGVRVQV